MAEAKTKMTELSFILRKIEGHVSLRVMEDCR